jgi:hypothetical protein
LSDRIELLSGVLKNFKSKKGAILHLLIFHNQLVKL